MKSKKNNFLRPQPTVSGSLAPSSLPLPVPTDGRLSSLREKGCRQPLPASSSQCPWERKLDEVRCNAHRAKMLISFQLPSGSQGLQRWGEEGAERRERGEVRLTNETDSEGINKRMLSISGVNKWVCYIHSLKKQSEPPSSQPFTYQEVKFTPTYIFRHELIH